MRNIRNEAGERTNPSMFVQGRQPLGQEPVPVACLDVLMQTRDQMSRTGAFFHPVGKDKGEGRCGCCLDGGVVLLG